MFNIPKSSSDDSYLKRSVSKMKSNTLDISWQFPVSILLTGNLFV